MRVTVAIGITLALTAIVFFQHGEASNDQWKYLGANKKGERFFYDAASVILVSQDVRHVWVKELSDDPAKRLEEINCAFKIIRDLQVINEGKARPQRRPPRLPSEWHAMEQDPITQELYKALCR
jgi:hypothetical protein